MELISGRERKLFAENEKLRADLKYEKEEYELLRKGFNQLDTDMAKVNAIIDNYNEPNLLKIAKEVHRLREEVERLEKERLSSHPPYYREWQKAEAEVERLNEVCAGYEEQTEEMSKELYEAISYMEKYERTWS